MKEIEEIIYIMSIIFLGLLFMAQLIINNNYENELKLKDIIIDEQKETINQYQKVEKKDLYEILPLRKPNVTCEINET